MTKKRTEILDSPLVVENSDNISDLPMGFDELQNI